MNDINDHETTNPYSDDRLIDRPPTTHTSPSGRYRLEIRSYASRPGCWNLSRGTVIRIADGEVVADVRRNYSMFHHSFVSKDGREYLVTGRSYMGQTIVCLDTGQEWNDPKWPDDYEGQEFCWAASLLSPDGRTLLVDGCHWACPYEYRFYDFEDLDRGWTELPVRDASGEAVWLEADDGRGPQLHDDGTIECFETCRRFIPLDRRDYEIDRDRRASIDEDAWKDSANWEVVVDRRVRLRRQDDHMLVLEDWRSEPRLARERAEQEADEAQDRMHEQWKARCTLLEPAREALAHHFLSAQLWITTPAGSTDPGTPAGSFMLCVETGQRGVTARLEFGVDEGPVVVDLGRHPGGHERRELPREPASLRRAAEALKRHLEPDDQGSACKP